MVVLAQAGRHQRDILLVEEVEEVLLEATEELVLVVQCRQLMEQMPPQIQVVVVAVLRLLRG